MLIQVLVWALIVPVAAVFGAVGVVKEGLK